MSAVRMVAYGVLELRHKEVSPFWLSEISEGNRNKELEENRQRDELRKLVSDELKRYGLHIQRAVVPKREGYHTRANTHELYGQKSGPKGFTTRELLHVGTFKECCVVAAALLDALDAAQVPDTAPGS